MGVEDAGKKVMLEAFGAEGVRCRLYDDDETELSGEGYEEQTISWTYDSGMVILNADNLPGEDYIAEFNVPAGIVKYIGVLDTDGNLLAIHDLEEEAETFVNPGVYQVISGSLELDPE